MSEAKTRKYQLEKTKFVLSDNPYAFLPNNKTENKKAPVKLGLVAVASKTTDELIHCTSGVLDDETCRTILDPAVLLVKYGTELKGGDYGILSNSWGANRGERERERIFRIECGVNRCSIILHPTVHPF